MWTCRLLPIYLLEVIVTVQFFGYYINFWGLETKIPIMLEDSARNSFINELL